MPRPKEDRKQEIIAAINQHLQIEGPRNWDSVMSQYPDVSRPTFYRYVKEARESIEDRAGQYGAGAIRLAQKRIRASVEPIARTQERIKAHLPASPSPVIIAGEDAHIEEIFNFMAYFGQIRRDADMVRDAAVTKNEDGTEKLKNPVMMDKSVGRRLGLLETYLHSMDTLWNLQRMQELYQLVIAAVGRADPETQRVILAELRQLDSKRGITMNARI